MPMTTDTPSSARKYPWSTWLDGQLHAFPESQLGVTVESFRSAARAAARNRGLQVTVLLADLDLGEGEQRCVTIEAFEGPGK